MFGKLCKKEITRFASPTKFSTNTKKSFRKKTNSTIASNVLQTLLNAPSVETIDTYFRFNLISVDPDDNKFIDCAIAANASFIVSNDAHFDVLKEIKFPVVDVKKLQEFSAMIS